MGGSCEESQILTRVIGDSKLDFEEMSTLLAKIKACLNSHPLGVIPHNNDDSVEVLTTGHLLIGCPLQAIPDHPQSSQLVGLLRRWYLCQALVAYFWRRWKDEYITGL